MENDHSMPVLRVVKALSDLGGAVTIARIRRSLAMRPSKIADALTVCLLRNLLACSPDRSSFWLTEAGAALLEPPAVHPDLLLQHSDSGEVFA